MPSTEHTANFMGSGQLCSILASVLDGCTTAWHLEYPGVSIPTEAASSSMTSNSLFKDSDPATLPSLSFFPDPFNLEASMFPKSLPHMEDSYILLSSAASLRYSFGAPLPLDHHLWVNTSQKILPQWCWSLLNHFWFLWPSWPASITRVK